MLDLLNQSSDTVVSRFVAAETDDPLRQRLRLSSLLSGANLGPTSMPISSILLIRKLCDPAPELLSCGAQSGLVPPEWERGMRDAIDQLLRRAARPAAGELTNSESAVLFSDRAELLACLARDWCDYRIAERWWWRALLRNDNSFWTTWIRNPEYVPAAMEQLARANKIIEFVAALTEEETRTLSQRVATVFALHNLTSLFENFDSGELPRPETAVRSRIQAEHLNQSPIEESRQTIPTPWFDTAPQVASASLSQWQELFVGLALMISRAPSLVRTRSFALAVERWQRLKRGKRPEPGAARSAENREPLPETTVTGTVPPLETTATRTLPPLETPAAETFLRLSQPATESSFESHQRAPRSQSQLVSENEVPSDAVQPAADRDVDLYAMADRKLLAAEATANNPNRSVGSRRADGALASTEHSIESATLAGSQTQPHITANRMHQDETEAGVDHGPIAAASMEPIEPEVFASVEIKTELGGLFYLINLALYLDLYGDFTRPAEPGLELNIWDFVALAGRDLTGDEGDDDPVWSLLAKLAGHDEGAVIGEGFEPEAEWQPPVEWKSAVALEQLNPESQHSRIKTSSAIQLWLSRLMPYARARLRAALDVDGKEDLGSLVCRHRAIIRTTETHVDVFFSLSEHRIELRMAGLDRDPGWVPAAGRFISFQYD
jgi:hypothetical protein